MPIGVLKVPLGLPGEEDAVYVDRKRDLVMTFIRMQQGEYDNPRYISHA